MSVFWWWDGCSPAGGRARHDPGSRVLVRGDRRTEAGRSRAQRRRLLVALDLGVADGVQNSWEGHDLETPDGVSVEVKASAYLQTWDQERLSTLSFDISPRRAWNPVTNVMSAVPRRHAQVYVFAVLATREQETLDPLDLQQWEFHVLPTSVLDARAPRQKSIRLSVIQKLGARPAAFGEIGRTIRRLGVQTDRGKARVERCPRCGRSDVVVPILFGYPGPEAMDAAARGELRLRGCILPPEPIRFHCERDDLSF